VKEAKTDRPISFKLDVMPVFLRSGCNSGSCHGAARGKDGFRLSLFGYDPEGDYMRLTREIATRRINLALPAESLMIQKTTGAVPHTGGTLFNIINGNLGADSIVGHSTIGDVLMGGQGADLIDASQSSGHNIVNGNIGADTVTGGTSGDFLRGGQGDDVIVGGAGSDWLSGDRGANTLTGGGGADLFHYGGGTDQVLDFSQAQGDRVVIDPGASFTAAQVGQDTVISVAGQGQMVLVGVQFASLNSGWIVQL